MDVKKIFYSDAKIGLIITYEDLFKDISRVNNYNKFCKEENVYYIFKRIVISLILGKEITLLDSDFTCDEIEKLVGNFSLLSSKNEIVDIPLFKSHEQFIDCIYRNKDTWRITLFTSGTTGVPKSVIHTFDSLCRFVRVSTSHQNSIWGFAYNPTHMAGLQVFFQALLNGNSIYQLFGFNREDQLSIVEKYSITHISGTPTFYRLLLPADRSLNSVKRLTSGGEKFNGNTLNQLNVMFPNAKITNIYASTEAGALFASDGDIFTLKEEFANLVKIENDELYLHKSLMGYSSTLIIEDNWYATGDLISVVEQHPLSFRIISRKNDMINVGGYKVNPSEVEEVIREHINVKDVYVYAKKNSLLGNVVCCEVVTMNSELSELQLRNYLTGKLQEFKIPRMIQFVESLSMTRTGKIARK